MRKIISIGVVACVVNFAAFAPSKADLANCNDLYVGAVAYQYNSAPLAVFLAAPNDTSGSYAISLADFTVEQQKAIIAILLAAKMSGHRVSITTAASGQCSITSTWQNLRSVAVNNNP